jgi:hypothetical protein
MRDYTFAAAEPLNTYLLFDEHLDGVDGDLESRLPVALGTSQVLLHRGIDVQDHYYCFLKYN